MGTPRSRSPRSHPPVGRLVAIGWVVLLALGLVWPAVPASAVTPESSGEGVYAGRSLEEVLKLLADGGLKIVFSSGVVLPEMRVAAEPRSAEPRTILDEVLRPFGLVAVAGPGETIVVVRAETGEAQTKLVAGIVRARGTGEALAGATVRALESGREVETDRDGGFEVDVSSEGPVTLEAYAPGYLEERLELDVRFDSLVAIELERLPLVTEQLVVNPSRLSLLDQSPAMPIGLSRSDIDSLPHLGGDFYRALTLLPGTTANDVGVGFHVRGARTDETEIRLDGQELYDAYHLKDYDSALSFVTATNIGSAELSTGGFPVRYGDRMSGVLEMTSVKRRGGPRFHLGLGLLAVQAGGGGSIAENKGDWLFDIRRGSGVFVDRLLQDGTPKFWDAFVKGERQLGRGQSLRLNLLGAGDELEFEESVDGEEKRFETDYSSSYLWVAHQFVGGARLVVESGASAARLDRNRRGLELEEEAAFEILDERDTDVLDLRQQYSALVGGRHHLEWGGRWRRFETRYDYFGTRDFDNQLAVIRHDFGRDTLMISSEFSDRQGSLFLSDRFRPSESLTVELGLRWDRHTLARAEKLSPRFNLAWAVRDDTVVRGAWGRFTQSQRTYELQVEDGETSFAPVERSDHRVVGLETLVGRGTRAPTTLRLEVYDREVANPRARYENLYEPLNVFPEVEPDRVRTAGDRSRARGLEVFARSRLSPRVGWWAAYTYATTRDRLAGRWVPRPFDETHGLSLDLDWRPGRSWRLNLAWRYHTGWPTTPLSLRADLDEEGEQTFVPVLGRLNSERLPSYHRLDLRASRSWERERMSIDFYVDLQNVYDRRNVAGFDVEIDDEAGTLVRTPEEWAGLLPSAGLRFEF